MKEELIRPEKYKKILAVYLQKDKKLWLSKKDSFEFVNCPACDTNEIKEKHLIREYTFATCNNCNTVYYNPRPTEEQLKHYYTHAISYTYWAKNIYPQTEEARRKNIFRPVAERLALYFEKRDTKLSSFMEIGAGFGIFCEEIKRQNIFKEIIAVEPTPDLSEICRSKGLTVLESTYENIDIPDNSMDCIVSFEVIEHLHSPKKFIQKINALLKHNGILLLTCPNIEGFDMSVLGKDKADNFGFAHVNMFNLSSLSLRLKKEGFEIIELSTPGKLDAELVRKKAIAGQIDLDNRPFLKRVLIDEWERLGQPFQKFLSENLLSSNMMIIGKKIKNC